MIKEIAPMLPRQQLKNVSSHWQWMTAEQFCCSEVLVWLHSSCNIHLLFFTLFFISPSTNQLSHIQHCNLLSTILVYFSLPYAYILAISKSCYLQSVTFIGTNAEISLHNINLIDRTLLRCVECQSVRQYIRTQRKTPHDILVKRLVSDIFGLFWLLRNYQ